LEKGLATKSRKMAGCFELSPTFIFDFHSRLWQYEMLIKGRLNDLSVHFFKLPPIAYVIKGTKQPKTTFLRCFEDK
jgi:hypothetical protein